MPYIRYNTISREEIEGAREPGVREQIEAIEQALQRIGRNAEMHGEFPPEVPVDDTRHPILGLLADIAHIGPRAGEYVIPPDIPYIYRFEGRFREDYAERTRPEPGLTGFTYGRTATITPLEIREEIATPMNFSESDSHSIAQALGSSRRVVDDLCYFARDIAGNSRTLTSKDRVMDFMQRAQAEIRGVGVASVYEPGRIAQAGFDQVFIYIEREPDRVTLIYDVESDEFVVDTIGNAKRKAGIK